MADAVAAVDKAVSQRAPEDSLALRDEDWRILAVLGPYRLLLVAVLLFLFRLNLAPDYFAAVSSRLFFACCFAYASLALALQFLALNPRLSASLQALLHFAVDMTALSLLVYATGGVSGGLGVLLVPPLVGFSLVLRPRLALLFAATATLMIFGQELLRQLHVSALDSGDFSQAGLLGLIFFATSLTAAMVGLRARRSEAKAARFGSEFISLTRINDNIIAAMQSGVLVVDAENRVRTANGAALRLSSGRAVVDQPLDAAWPELHAAVHKWRCGPASAPQLTIRGGGRELILRLTPLGSNKQAATLVMLEDAAVMRAQAQQMKLASLGRLSANIAHEIRNPLSAITQASQLLAEQPDFDGGNRRLLEMIQRHAGRIEQIVRSVLEISRRAPGSCEALALRDCLQRGAALYHEGHARSMRSIELGDVARQIKICFAPEQLQQVLFNLWDNSFEHGAAAGSAITVLLEAGTDAQSGLPYLDVSDDGCGLPAELFDRIFEPFFTTHRAGTGLGLYLCREICEYNHAHLSCVPRTNGACFRILFSTPEPAAGLRS